MGITDAILKSAGEDPDSATVTGFYADIQTLETFHLTPLQYQRLHRWDRQALKYYCVMKGYLEKQSIEKSKDASSAERKRLESAPPLKKV